MRIEEAQPTSHKNAQMSESARRRIAAVMNQGHLRIANDATLPRQPQLQIKIFEMQKITLVKTTHRMQRVGAAQHERTGY